MKRSGSVELDLKKLNISLTEALFIAKEHDILLLDDIIYREKIIIDKPYLTLIGKDNTKIVYDDFASKEYNGKKVGTTGSATLTLTENANYTILINLTIENDYLKKYFDGHGEQAVAFKSSASFIKINNCKFISYQDTFYIDLGYMNLVMNSYIEGDVDFIFGSADCLFYNTKISSKSLIDLGYYTAPSTLINNRYGLVFYKCIFDQLNKMETILSRAWYPSSAKYKIVPKLALIDSRLFGNINLNIIKMRESNPNYHELIIYDSKLNDELIENKGTFNLDYINKIFTFHKEKIN